MHDLENLSDSEAGAPVCQSKPLFPSEARLWGRLGYSALVCLLAMVHSCMVGGSAAVQPGEWCWGHWPSWATSALLAMSAAALWFMLQRPLLSRVDDGHGGRLLWARDKRGGAGCFLFRRGPHGFRLIAKLTRVLGFGLPRGYNSNWQLRAMDKVRRRNTEITISEEKKDQESVSAQMVQGTESKREFPLGGKEGRQEKR